MAPCVVLCVTSASILGGPLDPPPGPVTGTGKTLSSIEPRIAVNETNTPGDSANVYRITESGSYYLTENLIGQPGKSGIAILAPDVTIDFMGFSAIGVAGSFRGITTVFSATNVVIRDGAVSEFGDCGIYSTSSSLQILDMRVFGNEEAGIRAPRGDGLVVSRCAVFSNEGAGIGVNALDTRVSECWISSNGNGGLFVLDGVVSDCIVSTNSGVGITGEGDLRVDSCEVHLNSGSGIQLNVIGSVENCEITSNGSHGVQTSPGGSGLVGTSIAGCTITDNFGFGIVAPVAVNVEQCMVSQNTQGGIEIGIQSVVRGNTIRDGGVGIHVTGSDNVIDSNTVMLCDLGVQIDAPDNMVLRNVCFSNNEVTWNVVAGNSILVVESAAAGLIVGNAGGAPLGSLDANANYTR